MSCKSWQVNNTSYAVEVWGEAAPENSFGQYRKYLGPQAIQTFLLAGDRIHSRSYALALFGFLQVRD